MRKRIYFGITLLLIVGLLAGCSGVKKADVDAANAAAAAAQAQATTLQSQIATANAAATKAQADLAAAQKAASDAATKAAADLAAAQKAVKDAQTKAASDLAAANSAKSTAQADLAAAKAALDKANADLAAANATIATLKSGGIAPPKLDFAAKTYSNATNKFSFSYASSWGTGQGFVPSDTWLAWFSDQAYNCPAVQINKLPDTIASLSDVFTKNLNLTNAAVTASSITTAKNNYGITADVLEGTYNSDASTVLNVRFYGFKSGGFWWVMWFYQHSALGDFKGGGSNPVWAEEVFSTWQFTK